MINSILGAIALLLVSITLNLHATATVIDNPPPVIAKVMVTTNKVVWASEFNGFNRCVSLTYRGVNDLRVRHWYSYNVLANMAQFTDNVVPAGTYNFWFDGADHFIMHGAGSATFKKQQFSANRHGVTPGDCYLIQFLDPSVSVRMNYVLAGTHSGLNTTIAIPILANVSGTVTFSKPTSLESLRIRPVRLAKPIK